jgi:hypothetical protein
MFSVLSKYRVRSVYSCYCVQGPYPKVNGKDRKVAIGNTLNIHELMAYLLRLIYEKVHTCVSV